MLDKLFSSFSASRSAYLKIAAVILTIAIIGFPAVDRYGLSVDEGTEIAMVRRNFELITQKKPIPGDLMYFGTVFNFTAEAVFQAKEYIRTGFSHNPLTYDKQLVNEKDRLNALLERVKVKHYVTFFVSLITYFSVAGIVGIFCGWDYAWFGAVAMVFMPSFWGHSFFNPKDVPFAAIFTFCTFIGSYLVNHYHTVKDNGKAGIGINKTIVYSILFGILAGLLTGIRIGGLFLPVFIVLAYLAVNPFKNNKSVSSLLNLGLPIICMFVAWFLTTTIEHPAAWANPIQWMSNTIGYLSKHPLHWTTFFDGKELPIQDIPRYYLLKWVLMTVPLIFQISFIVGIGLIAFKYSKLSNLQRGCFVLVLLQVFFLPLVAVIKGSSDYDGLRHFLFILPGIVAIAAICLVSIYQSLPKKSFRLVVVAFIATVFAAIGFDMISLHPYEYIYFNRVSGGLAHAQGRYDTDYWGLSMREGMEWINKNAGANNEKVVIGGFTYSAQLFAAPNIEAIADSDYKPNDVTKPFYYLAWPRWGAQSRFPECPVVYSVVRQNVPLTIVKRCK